MVSSSVHNRIGCTHHSLMARELFCCVDHQMPSGMGLLLTVTPFAVLLCSLPSSLLIAFTISSFSFRTVKNVYKHF
jgi:hypothetical protein